MGAGTWRGCSLTWREAVEPVRMDRVAVVAPTDRLADVLVAVAEAGATQLERVAPGASLEEAETAAVRHDAVCALVGWSPHSEVGPLRDRLAPLGGAVAHLSPPRGIDPPTLVDTSGPTGAIQPLVDTYATVPYADLNPVLFAGPVYVVMFGMMFGDVGHGALLAAGGLLLMTGRPRALARFAHLAPFIVAAGLAAMLFGLAYGEAFGPTHLVPTLWISPLDHPTTLLAVGIAVGASLLAVAYGIGSVNRWREGGAARAFVETSGLAGAFLYLGLGLLALGWYRHLAVVLGIGGLLAASGITFGFLGCYAHAGRVVPAVIELFDSVLRMGTNTVSFARLAAFGLTHAALEQVVWSGTDGLWHRGAAFWVAAVVLFVIGNAMAFALEGLVAGIQALRLEYYELFSRIFVSEGRPFRPWRSRAANVPSSSLPSVPLGTLELPKEAPCSPG